MLNNLLRKLKIKGRHASKRRLRVKPRFIFICSGILTAGLILVIISAQPKTVAMQGTTESVPSASIAAAPDVSAAVLATETPTLQPTPVPTPMQLKEGMNSEEVVGLQERLMELDYMEQDLPTDYFGPATKYSLELFQRKHGLQIDGIYGEETKQLLFSDQAKKYTVSIGFSGTDVREIQLRLQELDYIQKVTDYFGDETEAAVKEFQSRNGLTADGSVGAQTKEALFSNGAKAFYYSVGTSGDEVLKLQKRLFALGYLTTAPDGSYGKDTENAIKRFQQKNGFIDDGYAGPETRTMLFSDKAERNALGMGDSGSDVKNIQQRLIDLKYLKDKSDGYFGSNTAGAVKAFQKTNGLSQDGKVGAQTLKALLSDAAKKAPAASSGGSSSSGNNNVSSQEKSVDALIEVAKSKLGAKYILGAKGPNTFDCSGFVYWCLNQIGVKQGYMTSGGWASTSKYPVVEDMKDLRAGDIISFKGHVGIALGGGKMIDSAPSGGGVRIGDLSNSYWIKNFIRGYRVL
jgi:peptidoglycan hydrolase-like protein with peptidoglycan-binding domain